MIDPEILAEIRKYGSEAVEREEGDIDYYQIMEEFKCSYSYARDIGRRMISSGKYKKLQIIGTNMKRMVVFRRIKEE